MKQVLLFIILALWAVKAAFFISSVFASEGRSPEWQRVRNDYIKKHPTCAACGRPATEVHHIMPFSRRPDLELAQDNLISLCDRDHLLFGHLDNYKSYNPHIREDAAAMLARIKSRPRLYVHAEPTSETLSLPPLVGEKK